MASDHVASRIRGRSAERPPSLGFPVFAALSCLLVTVVGFAIHVVIGVVGFVALVVALLPVIRALTSPLVDDSDHVRYY